MNDINIARALFSTITISTVMVLSLAIIRSLKANWKNINWQRKLALLLWFMLVLWFLVMMVNVFIDKAFFREISIVLLLLLITVKMMTSDTYLMGILARNQLAAKEQIVPVESKKDDVDT